jgi:hypothetical protein
VRYGNARRACRGTKAEQGYRGETPISLQVVNQKRNLGISEEKVGITQVSEKFSDTDPIKLLLRQLHPNPGGKKIQDDIYSEDNNHLRIMLFRHKVCHCGDSSFHLRWGGPPPQCSLFIDPRDQFCGGSENHVFNELDIFLSLVSEKTEKVLQALK